MDGHYGPPRHERRSYQGGGRGYRGRGGDRGRGGGGRRRYHQPYNNRRRGGNRNRQGNRFDEGGPSSHSISPQTAMLRQLSAMLSRVGELQQDANTTVQNITDLTRVLCKPESQSMFLNFDITTPTAQEQMGTLVHLLLSCVATLPLQTPTYAGLTLALEETSKKGSYSGLAQRCVNYAMLHVIRDLDWLLLGQYDNKCTTQETFCRLKLILRYLVLLGHLNVVRTDDLSTSVKENEDEDEDNTNSWNKLTLTKLLLLLVEAATAAVEQHSNITAAVLLTHLIVSTIPYAAHFLPSEVVRDQLFYALESLLSSYYKSTFVPGYGSTSILLVRAKDEDEDDDEEEESDDEEEEEDSGQVCDTLQDLMRCVASWMNAHYEQQQQEETKTSKHRFSLVADAPWKGLKVIDTNPQPDMESMEEPPPSMVYTGEPLFLSLEGCKSIPFLIHGTGDNISLQCFSLDGIVVGRLPFFGSPPAHNEDDGEESEDEDEMDDSTKKNKELEAYKEEFGLVDRYFLSESVRDCLVCYRSSVSPTGLERGSAKHVAEQVWSVGQLLAGSDNNNKGMEYAIIEVMLSLIVQSGEFSQLRFSYLSRVLLELTRLQPSLVSPALAVAVSNLFQDYLPALVPEARYNLSRWFAFHLINTDYQWPPGYWTHWTPYVASGKSSSRADFVRTALNQMVANNGSLEVLVKDCLPAESELVGHLLPSSPPNDGGEKSEMASLEESIMKRILVESDDPQSLAAYLVGVELAETVAGMESGSVNPYWRSCAVACSILQPARKEWSRMEQSLQRLSEPDSTAMDEEEADPTEDVLTSLMDRLMQYAPTLQETMDKDVQDQTANDASSDDTKLARETGEAILLCKVERLTSYSRAILESCVESLLKHKIVGGVGVLKWALGDTSDASTDVKVVERWSVLAVLAARLTLASAFSDTAKNSESEASGGMVVDRVGDSEEENGRDFQMDFQTALDCIAPLLQCCISRVCSVLSGDQSQETSKKMNGLQVELVEGTKTFAVQTKKLILQVLKGLGDPKKAHTVRQIEDALGGSDISGSMLAGHCSSGSIAVDILRKSLEQIK